MTIVTQILDAIRAGCQTSNEIAAAIRARPNNVSVALCRLADLGIVERAGVLNLGRLGRPYVRWRVGHRLVLAPPPARAHDGSHP